MGGIPLIAVSMGDPGGIGPEVILKALADPRLRAVARWVVFGSDGPLRAAGEAAGLDLPRRVIDIERFRSEATPPPGAGEVVLIDHPIGRDLRWPREPNEFAGAMSFQWVESAIALAREKGPWRAAAVVTGPISKQAWALAGHSKYPGHTELFAERFGVERFAMMFHAPCGEAKEHSAPRRILAGLNVILATVHRPLTSVGAALTSRRIGEVIALGHEAMIRLGVRKPRIGVCGLNPHAGEGGLLGSEDAEIIAPGVREARAKGFDASGPFPADTIFQGALSFPLEDGVPGDKARPDRPCGLPARFDLVVAMYHDQGLIPLKTLAWDRAVNMTVGLPIVRTSPDHGTAFDIAGSNAADAGSMSAAMRVAVRMVESSRASLSNCDA